MFPEHFIHRSLPFGIKGESLGFGRCLIFLLENRCVYVVECHAFLLQFLNGFLVGLLQVLTLGDESIQDAHVEGLSQVFRKQGPGWVGHQEGG